jgi:membrane-associated phospholipid phosphatase
MMQTVVLPAYAEPPADSTIVPAVSVVAPATQPDTTSTAALQPDRINAEYAMDYLRDTGTILTSPTRWNSSDWLTAGAVLGTTAGLVFLDENIRDIAQRNQNATGRHTASVGNALGNPLFTLPPLALFYLYGHVYEDAKARHASLLAVESLAISGAFTWTLKTATQRSRPFTGADATTWDGPGFKNTNGSFPSGHTQSAFAIASVLAEEYGNNPFVPPVAYSLASLTGLARIYDNKHWASDVFMGAAIGYFVGKAVVRYHTPVAKSGITVLPTVSQESFGLIVQYHF